MKKEIDIRVNRLLSSARTNVTTVASTLNTLCSTPETSGLTTLVLHNLSTSVDIYFGVADTVTTANGGGIVRHGTSREIPMKDMNYSPYFIASANASIGAEFWG